MSAGPRIWKEARGTLALAVPIVIGQLSQMLINVTDSVMIGQVGTVPLAASAFAGSVFNIFYIFGIGLLTCVPVLLSHARGASDPGQGRNWLRHGIVLSLVCSCASIGVMAALTPVLDRFGQPAEVVAIVGPYYLLVAASVLPALVFQVFRQFSEALGRPWVPMAIMLLSVLANVFLNWILIYGKWGAPALGLTGAGWATLISRFLGLLAVVWWLGRDGELAAWWPEQWRFGYSWDQFRRMLTIGIPVSGQLLFEAGAFVSAALMMGWLGTVPLAAHQIALSCGATTFMFCLGISSAASMRIAHAWGAGERGRLRPIGTGALASGVIVMSIFALVFVWFGEALASQFVEDRPVILLAARLLLVAAVFQIFDGMQVIAAGLLRGVADVKIPTAMTFVAYWVIALPGGYFTGVHAGYGPTAIWWALAAGLAVAALSLAARFYLLIRSAGASPAGSGSS
jgi:multidrug resistance protein, MATE family